MRRIHPFAGLVLAAAVAGCATTLPQPTAPLADFCTVAQTVTAQTALRSTNVLHTDFEAFTFSKPAVRPLETQQYARPQIISCKMKTADHLRTVFGDNAVGEEQTCAAVNAATLARLLSTMSPATQKALLFEGGARVVMDPDETTTHGPEWLKPYTMVYLGDAGALHIKAKGMRNDWLDPSTADAPARFRGTRYCHLITPTYLEQLLRGSATPAG